MSLGVRYLIVPRIGHLGVNISAVIDICLFMLAEFPLTSISLVDPKTQCPRDSRCVSCVKAETDRQRPAAVTVTQDRPVPDSALSRIIPMMDHANYVWCRSSDRPSSPSDRSFDPSDPMEGLQPAAEVPKSRSQRQAERRLLQDQRGSRFLVHRYNHNIHQKKSAEGTTYKK